MEKCGFMVCVCCYSVYLRLNRFGTNIDIDTFLRGGHYFKIQGTAVLLHHERKLPPRALIGPIVFTFLGRGFQQASGPECSAGEQNVDWARPGWSKT